MFSGIIESKQSVLSVADRNEVVEVRIKKPSTFSDLAVGQSICVDGVCLTIESFNEEAMTFALAAETLQITGWNTQNLTDREVNLERSMKVGDRIHGHFVAGHVDGRGTVAAVEELGESRKLTVEFPKELEKYLWKKGCVAVNGVSLTVNWVKEQTFGICLIPETLKQTNFLNLRVGSDVNLEADAMSRSWVRKLELEQH